MMFACATGAKFNMWATVLTQDTGTQPNPETGHWAEKQDPDTGEIIRVWVVDDEDTTTPGVQERRIPCAIRGIVSSGVTDVGTTERFVAGNYMNIDFVRMQFPAGILLSRRDRITSVTNGDGELIWQEEEVGVGVPTEFEILGITPVIDPFGQHLENTALLKRAEVQ